MTTKTKASFLGLGLTVLAAALKAKKEKPAEQ